MTNPMQTAEARISASAFADTKPHYDILDGLRGVAALTVVCFHLFEAYATSHLDQRINHGYLAVDFFFILSGFVVGYAYDDRWRRMSVGEFLKRRLIRLQPMVVIGALIGAAMFYTQGCSVWDVSKVTVAALLAATLMNALMIPATPGVEIRGVGEMYPLNGPSWSLFFEYIGNLLYAFLLRRLPTRALAAWVALAGCGLAAFALWGPYGDICVGFALTGDNIVGGSLRLLFAFSAGLLLSRVFRPVAVRGAFWIGGLAIVAAFVDERALRRLLRHRALPAHRLYRRLGPDDRPADRPPLQISGGHLLPALHGALPLHLPLLRMGEKRRAHLRAVAARRGGTRRRVGAAGLSVSETLRRTGTEAPHPTVPAHTQVAARPQSPMPEPIEGKRSHWRYSPSTSS